MWSRKKTRTICAGVIAVMVWLAGTAVRAQAPTAPADLPNAEQIIQYLNQTINWHRHVADEEQLATDPVDVLFLSDSTQLDRQVVQLAFDFAHAAAALSSSAAPAEAPPGQVTRYQTLSRAATQAENEIKQTGAEIASMRAELATAKGQNRRNLQSRLDETESEMELAQTRSEVLRQMLQFVSGAGAAASAGNLPAQIDELQRSVPEVETRNPQNPTAQTTPQTKSAPSAVMPAARKPETIGILSLVTSLIAQNRKMRVLQTAIEDTDALNETLKRLRTPIITNLTGATKRGEELANQADSTAASDLPALKQQLDTLTAHFKQLSTVMLPLAKESILLASYRNNLQRWHDTVKSEYGAELKDLLVRIIVFGGIILVVLSVAEIWRKAIFRYVHDVRRRYQFLLLRRIVLWLVIGITIAFAMASEIGSIATFAGLITAGLAVALQNVILAIAGYFFLIGKYGVRVGDRVQISGITGDVIDVGLIRLHLMEIGGSGTDRHPTGRVVVFSNSVVFQPTASFYKQIPGTNFVWHEVSLMLAPDTDYRMAEQRMLSAVETVYAGYRERIEAQHQQMQRALDVRVAKPQPHSGLHLTQSGLEVVIRYPVEIENAAEVDDHITRELLRALQQPPKLRLVGTGIPNIQPVAGSDGAPVPAPAAVVPT